MDKIDLDAFRKLKRSSKLPHPLLTDEPTVKNHENITKDHLEPVPLIVGKELEKMADEFFGKFSELAAHPELLDALHQAEEPVAPGPTSSIRKTLAVPNWIWLTGLLVTAILIYQSIFSPPT